MLLFAVVGFAEVDLFYRCGAHICWICLRVCSADMIYDHLNARHGGIHDGDIYNEEDEDDEEEEEEYEQFDEEEEFPGNWVQDYWRGEEGWW